jgi:methylated-DNA-[protein]-cysteine S-methyltransferase
MLGGLAAVASGPPHPIGAGSGGSSGWTSRSARIVDGVQALRFETAIGTCGVRWNARGIAEVLLPGSRGIAGVGDAPDTVLAAVRDITDLLAGKRRDLRAVVLDDGGLDEFRRRVYVATRDVGPGETATYGEIARRIGAPGAARAVGAALGANPFPIVVPCHRVLAATGALHGFSAPGGIATKRHMLEIERAPGFTQTSLFA